MEIEVGREKTNTKRALEWLAAGGLRKDMEADLGLSREQCRVLVNWMRKAGYIEPTYVLTDRGRERNEFVPKSSQKALAHWRAHYRRNREVPESAEKTVERAMRLQPNSVFALGGKV